MKIRKIMPKLTAAGLILLLLIPFSGCVRDERFDYSELNLRLAELGERFSFDEETLFFADGVYYCYYTLGEPEDALLTMKEDADGKLDRVTLALAAPPTDARYGIFKDFALALTEVFIPNADKEAIRAQMHLDAPDEMLARTLSSYGNGFYSASVLAVPQGVCFMMEYSVNYEAPET